MRNALDLQTQRLWQTRKQAETVNSTQEGRDLARLTKLMEGPLRVHIFEVALAV